MYSQKQIDPVVSFLNAQGAPVRGTIVKLRREALVMEVYDPPAIAQISELARALTIRLGARDAYVGKAVVVGLVNTGLAAMVTLRLMDAWREPIELEDRPPAPGAAGLASAGFVREWDERPRIRPGYQGAVHEARAFLADMARWAERVDLAPALPRDEDGRLRADVFMELAAPLALRIGHHLDRLDAEAAGVEEEDCAAHRAYAQSCLHPLLLRAPYPARALARPLGHAGDHHMVNQLLEDPRQGPDTHFQIVNAAFLDTPLARAQRNRIDLLVEFLRGRADAARATGRPFRVLSLGCGPAVEVQRFLREYDEPHWLSFELLDFSEAALAWTRERLAPLNASLPRQVDMAYAHEAVHRLLLRPVDGGHSSWEFDVAYCAGPFDYLTDKVCARLTAYLGARLRGGGSLLVAGTHTGNPVRHALAHLLEWHLVHRDETAMERLLPPEARERRLYTDATGVNVVAEATWL
ncbi:class I SAM-dependent methyltransferase [Pseudoduganella namucuonensis]|uniref:class I SAM-dependent methyltransferase n=1 Tax=Pseudoduganella namucuonensis TaxID=1035707 RepID=UPI000B84D782|nr:class I SAM-dependent methyltransferase [Pseudoduganella namucuonensis]